MPKRNGIGESEITCQKQKDFTEFVRAHLPMALGARRKWSADSCYYYFDLYAGDGLCLQSPDESTFGSPLIFLNEVYRYNRQKNTEIRFQAVFIDKQPENITALKVQIEELFPQALPSVICACGDNQDLFPQYWKQFKRPFKKLFGLVYADPNGEFNESLLGEFSRVKCYDRLDLLINSNCTQIKRSKGAFQKKNLIERLLTISGKKYWYTREPLGPWQWSFLLGTNWNRFPKVLGGLHDVRSREGQNILERVAFTPEEPEEESQRQIQSLIKKKRALSHLSRIFKASPFFGRA